MATFAQLKAKIADDVARSDLTSQIEHEVLAAIEDCSIERFWFNETRGYTFSTVAGTSDYTISPTAAIQDFVKVDSVKATIGGNPVVLDRYDADEIDTLIAYNGTDGQPYCYGYYNQTFRLYPIPGDIYTVRVAGHYKLTALSADGDTNAWTVEGYELIRARAKSRLYVNVIRNQQEAAAANAVYESVLFRLRAETSRRVRTGRVKPSSW